MTLYEFVDISFHFCGIEVIYKLPHLMAVSSSYIASSICFRDYFDDLF